MTDVSTATMRIIDRHCAVIAASERAMAANKRHHTVRPNVAPNPLHVNDARIMPTIAGAHGGNLAVTNMDSINNCRMRKSQASTIRIPSNVGPTSGFMAQSSVAKPLPRAKMGAKRQRQLAAAKRRGQIG